MKPALLLLVLGCVPEGPGASPPAHAPGTVLLVDDLPLLESELDPLCADIHALYPEYSPVHVRRLALTNEHLPRLAARALDPEGWQRARSACERVDVQLPTTVPVSQEGTFHGLSVSLWSAARHLTVGDWSPPLELAGRWLRLRLDERVPATDAREERLRVSLLEFPFLDRAHDPRVLETAVDRARLTLVDPQFGEAVPEAWKHRMRTGKP